jgi:outer membrane protein insertion porin family
MRCILSAALLCSWALMSLAQVDSHKAGPRRQPPPGTLHSITVKGNHLYSSADIVKYSGLNVGQRVTGPIIEQARTKLQSTELFTNVSDTFRFVGSPPAYDLTIEVAEIDQLFPMRFERLGVSSSAVQQYLRDHVELYSDRIPGTEGVLKRYAAAVQELVRQTDPSMKVKARVSNDDPKELAVLFAPDTPPPTISQVIVTGNQAVDTGTILRAVNQVAIGVPLSDTRLKLILDGAIKPLYAAKGYAAVTFPKVETEPSKTNRGVVVRVEIKDGPVFKFGAIRFHGSGLDEEEIRSSIPFKPTQAFNGKQVDEFRLDLVHRMKRRGLLDASVTTETQPDDSKRVVNVTYNVSAGAVYNFQKLDIQGLDVTTEPVVARLWGLKPGKPFNPDYPDFFLKRVQEQGLFDNLADTRSDYTADAASHGVTVHLYFKGGNSKQQTQREKKEEEERRQGGDGTWSPFPR